MSGLSLPSSTESMTNRCARAHSIGRLPADAIMQFVLELACSRCRGRLNTRWSVADLLSDRLSGYPIWWSARSTPVQGDAGVHQCLC
jgi:hypothetical protein